MSKTDSLKEWTCPLPVEVTIRTMDKRKIECAIIEADDSGFVALDLMTDTAIQASSEWKRRYFESQRERWNIDGDRSLSEEEKYKLMLQKSIGVIYRDTIRVELVDIEKITFHYSSASRFQKVLPMGAYIVSGCVFLVGISESIGFSDPEGEESMEAPYPTILLLGGLAGLTASGMWIYHTYHKVIRPRDRRLRR